jgi:hypothetical protein
MAGEPIGIQLYRAYGVPWLKDDVHERLKSAQQTDFEDRYFAARQGGRAEGSFLVSESRQLPLGCAGCLSAEGPRACREV